MEGVRIATDIDPSTLNEVLDRRDRAIRIDPDWGQVSSGGIKGPHSRFGSPRGANVVGIVDVRRRGTRGGFIGACEISVVEGPWGQGRVCTVTALDKARETEVLKARILRDNVELGTGTGRIRFKVHDESIGRVRLVDVLASAGRGRGDVAQNTAIQILELDNPTVTDLRRFRIRSGFTSWVWDPRRVGTADGGTTSHNRVFEREAPAKERSVRQTADCA